MISSTSFNHLRGVYNRMKTGITSRFCFWLTFNTWLRKEFGLRFPASSQPLIDIFFGTQTPSIWLHDILPLRRIDLAKLDVPMYNLPAQMIAIDSIFYDVISLKREVFALFQRSNIRVLLECIVLNHVSPYQIATIFFIMKINYQLKNLDYSN